MKKIFKFIYQFLNNLVNTVMALGLGLLIFIFGAIVVTSLWGHGMGGKIILVIAGVYLVGTSAIEACFKIINEQQEKKLAETSERHKELYQELEKIMTKKKSQDICWRFWEYLKTSEENENGKK
jgi:hypothetical protein